MSDSPILVQRTRCARAGLPSSVRCPTAISLGAAGVDFIRRSDGHSREQQCLSIGSYRQVIVVASHQGAARPTLVGFTERPALRVDQRVSFVLGSEVNLFFFKHKTAYAIGLGIPAQPLFRSNCDGHTVTIRPRILQAI